MVFGDFGICISTTVGSRGIYLQYTPGNTNTKGYKLCRENLTYHTACFNLPSNLEVLKYNMATADSGYFLTPPPLSNPFSSDPVYQRTLSAYLPPKIFTQIQPSLHRFAAEAISESVHDFVRNAESQPPFVKTRNVWGSRPEKDRLVTSDGWKQLGKWGLSNGYVFWVFWCILLMQRLIWVRVVAHGYEDEFGEHRRVVQHALCVCPCSCVMRVC